MEIMDIIQPLENINIVELCRVCFETCEQYKLLFEDAEGIEKRSMGDVFFDVAKIEMKTSTESAPNRICLPCSKDLMNAYKFIRKSQQNNDRLLEYLKNSSSTKQPDCLSEFPIDIPIDTSTTDFLQIKVENETISEYAEQLAENKISPPSSSDSTGSDYDDMSLHEEEKVNKLQCTYCSRIFKRMDFFESHKRKHEEEIKKKETTEGSSSFLCDECGVNCATKFDLKSHRLANHTTSYNTDRDIPSDDYQTDPNCSVRMQYPDKYKGVNKKWRESASPPELKAQLNETSIFAALPSFTSSSFSSLEKSSTSKNKFIFSGRFFTIVKQLNNTEFQKKRNGILAECCTCKSRIQGSFQITSNFKRHLRMKHPNVFEEYELVKSNIHRPKNSVQEQFDVLVVKFLANNMLPIRIVEDKSFRHLVRFTNSDLNVMSKPMALEVIDKVYSSMVSKIKDTIATNKHFCTTADVWSTKHRTFLTYTCHWLDESFQRKSVALSCKRFHGSPSNSRIKDMIEEIHSEFSLNCGNIVATVTDNGANSLNAFKECGIESNTTCYSLDMDTESLESSYEEEFQSLEFKNQFFEKVFPKPMICATHTLNLIASTDFTRILKKNSAIFTKHTSVMQKCSNLWSKVNRPKTSEEISSVLGSQLKYPVATRWKSLFDSIKDIISHTSKLGILCERLEIPNLSDADFDYLEDYVQVLSPICEALDFLEHKNGMIYGYLLPTLATVRTKYRKIRINNSLHFFDLEILSMLDEALIKRFQSYFDLTREAHDAIVASVLCPSVKLKWISALNPSFNDEKLVEISVLVRKAIQTEYDVRCNSGQREAQNEVAYFDFFIYDDLLETTSTSTSASTAMDGTAENEYFAYLANPSVSMDMLNRYPTIKATFLRYNTPLPSSAAVERLFSFAELINISRRGVLLDANFEKLLLLKVNNLEET